MISKWFVSLLCGISIVGTTLTSALPASAEQAPDKNGPGVVRVSVVEGSTVIARGDSNTQTNAVVNAPLLPGDYISTGSSSRAELQFDGETAVRLGGNVQARITNDDPNSRRLQLADGTVEVGIVHAEQPMDIDTPSVSVRAREVGDYRVTIDRDGSTWVTARRGQAEVVTPQRTYDLTSGRTLVARGAASDPSVSFTSEVGFDSFDDFNAKRDESMVAALNASPNLAPNIAGYDNLDQYGNWDDVAGYGQVWVPNESPDWAPYRDGSWSWEGGYGWTWVGSEPWGWAPYHYGRWFWANGYGWAWYPPAYSYYTPWYPALVGFYGWGGGIGLGFGYPYIGWCPLAPFEPFYAWYPGWFWGGWGWGFRPFGFGFGPRVVNITRITNIYRNFGHGGGSGTLRGNFERGNFLHNVAVTPRNVGHVGQIRGSVPIKPSPANLRFSQAPSRHVTFSKAFDSSRFASNRALTARTSFADQQRSVAGTLRSDEASRGSLPAGRGAETTGAGETTRSSDPMRSSDTIRSSDTFRSAARMTGMAASSSWSRFNQDRGSYANSSYSRGESSYSRGESSYSRGESSYSRGDNAYSRSSSGNSYMYSRNPYASSDRNPYGSSYSRNPYESSSRNPYGSSYSRNPYGGSYSRGSYPSYSRGSSPSYSRGSYPSYSRGSYPSYSRGSAPSYSRGSVPSYSRGSAPSYSHGSSGGGGHSSGGGGGGGHGGGRPPH